MEDSVKVMFNSFFTDCVRILARLLRVCVETLPACVSADVQN